MSRALWAKSLGSGTTSWGRSGMCFHSSKRKMGEMWGKSADLDCEWRGMQLAGVGGCPLQTPEKVWRTPWGPTSMRVSPPAPSSPALFPILALSASHCPFLHLSVSQTQTLPHALSPNLPPPLPGSPSWDFPGGPVAKTPSSQGGWPGFDCCRELAPTYLN